MAGKLFDYSRRDARVETLRIYACLGVLALHIKPSSVVEGEFVFSRVLHTCLVSDSVTVFLFIAGFYLLKPTSYAKRLSGCCKRIVLPAALYSLFAALLLPVIYGAAFSLEGLSGLWKSVVTWEPVVNNTGHLWYLYAYVPVILLAPALSAVRDRFFSDAATRRRFLAAMLVLLALNDISMNRLLRLSNIPVFAVFPMCIAVLFGSALYERREQIRGSRTARWAGLGIYLGIALVRAAAMYKLLPLGASDHLYYWYTAFGMAGTAGLCAFALSFGEPSKKLKNAVCFFGEQTMNVYILHPAVIEFANERWGLRGAVAALVCDGTEKLSEYLKFTACYGLVIFLLCCAVSVVLKLAVRLIAKLFEDREKAPETASA